MDGLPDAIFFDWDGTLVDTLPGLLIAHNHVRTHFGFPVWTRAEFHRQMTLSSRELYPVIYGERADEAFTILRSFLDKHLLEYLSPLKNAEVLLRRLHKMKIPLGLVSNKRHEYVLREVQHLGWDKYLDIAVGSGYAERDKPSGIPIRKALADIGVKPEDCLVWFVGDTETDMKAAVDSGCLPVLILHGTQQSELIEKYSPAYVFEDCQDLLSSLEI